MHVCCRLDKILCLLVSGNLMAEHGVMQTPQNCSNAWVISRISC